MRADESSGSRDQIAQTGSSVCPMLHSSWQRMATPGWAEIVLLLTLLFVSLFLFARKFAPVLRTILRSRPEPGFDVHPISARVKKFVWEVLFQAKVIKERPLPGLAHAFVFWGFLAFA